MSMTRTHPGSTSEVMGFAASATAVVPGFDKLGEDLVHVGPALAGL